MEDNSAKKAYELLERKRMARAAANQVDGKSLANMASKALPVAEEAAGAARASTLGDVLGKLKERTNLENTVKRFEGADPRMAANVRHGLGNNKGFAKLLPMLGLGGAALAASSMFNKAQAGDLGGAAMEGADLATDYIPGVSNAKMALQSDELGTGEEQAMKEIQQMQKAQQSNNPESRRFAKIRELMK